MFTTNAASRMVCSIVTTTAVAASTTAIIYVGIEVSGVNMLPENSVDEDKKIWLFEGNARVDCKAICKNAYFLGGDSKVFAEIKELLALGTFRM